MLDANIEANSQTSKKASYKKFFIKLKRQKFLQFMVLPGIIWMIVFNFIPMYGIIIAFKNYTVIDTITGAPWAGLTHFKEFLSDENFGIIMKNTLGISFFRLLIGFPLPIIFALLLNELRSIRFKKFVQTISYLPHFLSWVVLGGIMMTWLSETGVINVVLQKIGLVHDPTAFLAHPKYFWTIAVSSDVWKELGWSAIIYLAAIAGIDPELYEAATVDGAGKFKKMWNITIPCIQGTIAMLFILAVSNVMNSNFDQILVLKNAVNRSSSEVIDTFVYQMGIVTGRFSYSTAIGLFKSVIALILLVVANQTTKRLNGSSLF